MHREPESIRPRGAPLDEPGQPWIDPGWLFLIAGVAVIMATVLIPAAEDLAAARWQRDRALAVEAHRAARVERYAQYLEELQRPGQALVLSLAATQLNQIPHDRALLVPASSTALTSASVFPALEPPPPRLPERRRVDSVLARITTHERSRVWVLAAGVLCLLVGLVLPLGRARV